MYKRQVYAPWIEPLTDKKGETDLNNNSIVGKLIFGKFSMLFTGDAVSYTHLDVYKRQVSQWMRQSNVFYN